MSSNQAETSGLDAKFILEKANVTHLVDLPGMYDTSPVREKSPEEFYMESSHETVHRLHHAYRHDFRFEFQHKFTKSTFRSIFESN